MKRLLSVLVVWALALPSTVRADFCEVAPSGGEARWVCTAPMAQIRLEQHSSSLLPDGSILLTSGERAEIYHPRLGGRLIEDPLHEPRESHSSTVLASGDVLIVGGLQGERILSSAEVFDVDARTWRQVGSLDFPVRAHTASLLETGEVLIVGGMTIGGDPQDSVLSDQSVVMNLAGDSIESLEVPLSYPRYLHTATKLIDGRILVVGGVGEARFETEVFDPQSPGWQPFLRTLLPRSRHSATLLPDGRLLVMGGDMVTDNGPTEEVEMFIPDAGGGGEWQRRAPMNHARRDHESILLADGRVLVSGGCIDCAAEAYDPYSDSWTVSPSFKTGPRRNTLLLPGQGVFAVGNEPIFNSGGEIFAMEAASSRLAMGRPLNTVIPEVSLAVAPHRGLTLIGGLGSFVHVQDWDTLSETWEQGVSLTRRRSGNSTILMPSGHYLVIGGSFETTAETFDPATQVWSDAVDLGSTGVFADYRLSQLLPSGEVLTMISKFPDQALEAEIVSVNGALPSGRSIPSPPIQASSPLAGNPMAVTLDGRLILTGLGADLSSEHRRATLIFDPKDDQWRHGPETNFQRIGHTTTTLSDGSILVAGGTTNPTHVTETWIPEGSSWRPSGFMSRSRSYHSATVLSDGRVLVAGGTSYTSNFDSSVEIYDPTSGNWTLAPPLQVGRFLHAALLLDDGRLVITGGATEGSGNETEIYDPYFGVSEELRPVITDISPEITFGGEPPFIKGTGFVGPSEGASGTSHQSVTNHPLVTFRHLESDHLLFVPPDGIGELTEDGERVLKLEKLPALMPGHHYVTVIVNGVPSRSEVVQVTCGMSLDRQPEARRVVIGETATFSVDGQGIRSYQWLRDGVPIPGATGATFTTPPVAVADSGAVYSVRLHSGCSEQESEGAELVVEEPEPPEVRLESPRGGEIWLLSSAEQPRGSEFISWTMSDNARICEVRPELLFSEDGESWQVIPGAFGPPVRAEPCRGDGLDVTTVEYVLPPEPPSGTPGSLYKAKVTVVDHSGNVASDISPNPFFFVRPDEGAFETLIVWNRERMREAHAGDPEVDERLDELAFHLEQLADHPRVAGLLLDLGQVDALRAPYQAWDADASASKANELLFGCLDGTCTSLHGHLRTLFQALPALRYLLIVGDDRIVPMSRLIDRTGQPEDFYATESTPGDGQAADRDAISVASTVGRSLASGHYLSDDPLAARRPLEPGDLLSLPILPDLMPGRLVETPREISRAITRFLGADGLVDVTEPGAGGSQVTVTGYDFLVDGALAVERRWRAVDPSLAVDGELISSDWGIDPTSGNGDLEARRQALGSAMNGGSGLLQLLGHATHHSEGVPGDSLIDIHGLRSRRLYDPGEASCPASGPPDVRLEPSWVLAVGCHGGLSVPGSCSDDADRSLDLPQAYLGAGALVYVANSGYGWGLDPGIGLAERLLRLATEAVTTLGNPSAGEAVHEAKRRYWRESARIDAYDEKTVLQWTLYGFPMAGISLPTLPDSAEAPAGHGGRIDRQPVKTETENPWLSRLTQTFTFGSRTFRKLTAAGDEITTPGCPDSSGCYFTLNDLASGGSDEADLPIQPIFLQQDTRLSGTSQHGLLWLGGEYHEEQGDWLPVFPKLVSNRGELEAPPVALPRTVFIRPIGNVQGGQPLSVGACRSDDPEPNGLVYVAGETLLGSFGSSANFRQRLHRRIDVELFYLNDQQNPANNCDREGPRIETVGWSRLGPFVDWRVSATDPDRGPEDVWRVVVVCTDGKTEPIPGPDGRVEHMGSWRPLDLEFDGELWRGRYTTGLTSNLTCFVQAVDRRGNVSWRESGDGDAAPPGLPEPVEVPAQDTEANVTVSLTAEPEVVSSGDLLLLTVHVVNQGPNTSVEGTLRTQIPETAQLVLASAEGWDCEVSGVSHLCGRLEPLGAGETSSVRLLVRTPALAGTLTFIATVNFQEDLDPADDLATLQVASVDQTVTDLEVVKTALNPSADPSEPVIFTIQVINHGPHPAFGATVRDVFSPLITHADWRCVTAGGASCSPTGTGDIADVVDLPVGGEVFYTVVAIAGTDREEPVPNTAWVDLPPGMGDFEPGDNVSFAEAPPPVQELFSDGFEGGDCSIWSSCSAP